MKDIIQKTLYVTEPDIYLSLDGGSIKAERKNEDVIRLPLTNINEIFCFSYLGASPQLIGTCVERHIGISFFTPFGKFLFRAEGDSIGNVELRRKQYFAVNDNKIKHMIANNIVHAKVHNGAETLAKFSKLHPLQVNNGKVQEVIHQMRCTYDEIDECSNMDYLRGLEGKCAQEYFSVFPEMLLNDEFSFNNRTKRPPMDEINAMLSFGYTLLANTYASALSGVGLDPYAGFIHSDRSGRYSLALDMMEEMRSSFVDRFVISLVNNRIAKRNDFVIKESGAVEFTDSFRKVFLREWQTRKNEEITHPFIDEKISWGVVPYVQAKLLSQFLRENIDGYPPFFWR